MCQDEAKNADIRPSIHPYGQVTDKVTDGEYLQRNIGAKDHKQNGTGSARLGYRFELIDGLYTEDRACVRYKAIQNDFQLDVSEWYYL